MVHHRLSLDMFDDKGVSGGVLVTHSPAKRGALYDGLYKVALFEGF